MVITSANWNKSKPHSAYNSDHTHNSIHCRTVDVDLQDWVTLPPPSPLSLSLSLSSPHLLPCLCLNISFLSSLTPLHRDVPFWIRQLYPNAIPLKPANTLRSRGAHTEGCFIARRAVTRDFLLLCFYLMREVNHHLLNVQSTTRKKLFREAFAVAHMIITWSRRRLAASGKGKASGRASV